MVPLNGASASFVEDGATVLVSIQNGPAFRIPPGIRAEFDLHFRDGEYAAEIAAFLREAASPGTLFDVGARNALFALIYCHVHPSNRAFAYEPSPLFGKQSNASARLNGVEDRLQIVPKAIAESSGFRTLLLDGQTGCMQAMQFEGTTHEGWVEHLVETTTLDIEAGRVGDPSFVKIDVEGYEREVLQGAAQLLARSRPVVLLELHLNFLEERGIPPLQVTRLLTGSGYRLYDLAGRRMSEHGLARTWANVKHVIALPPGSTRAS